MSTGLPSVALSHFKVIRKICSSSHSELFLCETRRTSRTLAYFLEFPTVVLKVEKGTAEKHLIKELLELKCPTVIRYLDFFQESSLCVHVLEYAPEGDLSSFLKQNRQPLNLEGIFIQLLIGVRSLHARGIVHRDLKPRNILVIRKSKTLGIRLKIGDFGSAKQLSTDGGHTATIVGTPYYLSPEICKMRDYDLKTDVWSLGCLFYELATGRHPFEGKDIKELVHNIRRVEPIPADGLKTELREFLMTMLEKDPSKRPSINSLLNHPFIRDAVRDLKSLHSSESRVRLFLNEVLSENFSERRLEDLSLLAFGHIFKFGMSKELAVESLIQKWKLLHEDEEARTSPILSSSSASPLLFEEIDALSKQDNRSPFEPYSDAMDEDALSQIPRGMLTKIARLLNESSEGDIETRLTELIGREMHKICLEHRIYGRLLYLLKKE